jgi:hypothetical protein
MRKNKTRARVEAVHGQMDDLLRQRLKAGRTMREIAEELGIPAGTIYFLARDCGFDTYWVLNGREIVARVP